MRLQYDSILREKEMKFDGVMHLYNIYMPYIVLFWLIFLQNSVVIKLVQLYGVVVCHCTGVVSILVGGIPR